MISTDVWFNGAVKDAVSLVTQRNCVFLVYIYDESEKTEALDTILKEEKVTEAIQEHSVALAMKNDSENAAMFAQFYKIQTVPILYFIKYGTIRDFCIETMTGQDIIEKLEALGDVLPLQPTPETTTVSSPLPPPSATAVVSEPVNNVSDSTDNIPAAASTTATSSTTLTSSSQQADTAKAHKEALQKQLDQVRQERANKAQQEKKAQELKRRQDAKATQQAQLAHQDKEMQAYFAKLKKEKKQEEEHKRRVREQIAQDRAEKTASKANNKSISDSNSMEQPQQQQQSSSSSISTTCNLNIRQLDGSCLRHQFEATTTLAFVREWIKTHRTDSSVKPFKLSAQFPTRLLVEEDQTLQAHQLCPSATIIMKPLVNSSSLLPNIGSSSVATATHQRDGMGLVQYAVYGFDAVYGFLLAFLNILTGLLAALFPTTGPRMFNNTGDEQQQQQQPFLRNKRGGQRLGTGEDKSKAEIDIAESTGTSKNENSSRTTTAQKRNPYATRITTLDDDAENDLDDKRKSTYNGNSVNHE